MPDMSSRGPRVPRQRTGSITGPGFGVWRKAGGSGGGRSGGGGGGKKSSGCAILALALVSASLAVPAGAAAAIWQLLG